jgi:C1A family cysteine protease
VPRRVPRNKSRKLSRNAARPKRFHGWIPDLPDHRDLHYAARPKIIRNLPPRIDLRSKCPPIYKQGRLNSCTAHAIAAAIQFEQMKQFRRQLFRPSRLFIYYNERAIEHSIHADSGAQIRNGIKSVAKKGVCAEHLWRYRPGKFRHRPGRKCYLEAAKHPAVSYYRVRRVLGQLKACLASGYPFVFGFTVYESFHSKKVARTGRARMPAKHDKVRGGHAVLAVGYNDAQRRFIVRNSWGTKWGMGGYFTLPYDYLANHHLSEDFWTIRVVK